MNAVKNYVKAFFVSLLVTTILGSFFISPAVAKISTNGKLAAKSDSNTEIIRKSTVSKDKIVETSIENVVTTEVRKEANASKSQSQENLGEKVLQNSASLKVSVSTSRLTKKTLTETTVITTVKTTKVETFKKAKKTKLKFTFAMGSPGLSGALIRESLERMNFKYGYNGSFQEIASSDLVVAGAAAGQFEMGSSTTSAIMKVIQGGAPIQFVGETQRNQWTLVSKSAITKCEDANGKRLGLHSPGGVSTALYRAWFVRNCQPTVKPQELFIAGSPNRLQAMISDRLDLTMMEVEDTLQLPPTGYRVLSNFSKDLPNVKTGLVWANNTFYKKHPEIVSDFIYEMARLNQEVNGNPKVFVKIALKWQPVYPKIEQIVAAVIAAGLFPNDPGSFYKDLTSTAAFYAAGGTIKPGLIAKDMAVLEPLNRAMKRLEI